MIALALLCEPAAAGATFEELLAHATTHATTSQTVDLDARIMNAQVGSSVSRLLPSVSLSESLTSQHINTDRYTTGGQTAEDCEALQGRPCDPFVILDGRITIPDQTLSDSVSLTGRQTLWSSSSVIGLLKTKKQASISDLRGVQQLEGQAWELIEAYVDLQVAVEDLQIERRTVQLSERSLSATQASFGTGTANDLDLALADLDVRQARTDLAQAERAVPRTLLSLWDTAGYAGPAQQVCPLIAVPDRGDALALDAATSALLSQRSTELDRLNRTESQLSLLPTLSASGGLSWSGSGSDLGTVLDDFGFNYWFVGGSLSWTLFSGLSRYHDNRSSTFSVHQGALEHDQELRDLALTDAEYAADLNDLAEDLDLLGEEVALNERSVRAMLSRFEDGGQVPLDAVLSSQSALESLRSQVLATRHQQVLTFARRWIDAGRTDELLAALTESDAAHAATGQCTELTP